MKQRENTNRAAVRRVPRPTQAEGVLNGPGWKRQAASKTHSQHWGIGIGNKAAVGPSIDLMQYVVNLATKPTTAPGKA